MCTFLNYKHSFSFSTKHHEVGCELIQCISLQPRALKREIDTVTQPRTSSMLNTTPTYYTVILYVFCQGFLKFSIPFSLNEHNATQHTKGNTTKMISNEESKYTTVRQTDPFELPSISSNLNKEKNMLYLHNRHVVCVWCV